MKTFTPEQWSNTRQQVLSIELDIIKTLMAAGFTKVQACKMIRWAGHAIEHAKDTDLEILIPAEVDNDES
jgi:hypothetical protein